MLSFKQFIAESTQQVWWYNARTGKSIRVERNFWIHTDVIELAPEKLGLTDKDVLSLPGAKKNDQATREFFSNRLVDVLKKQGWMQIQVSVGRSVDEAIIRSYETKDSQKALKWLLNKVNPNLQSVYIVQKKSPRSISLQGQQVDQFAKTGKGSRLSSVAVFR